MEVQRENLVFEESYLLGWEFEGDRLTLYVELLLTEEHPLYRDFDPRSEFGFYFVGRLLFEGSSNMSGFPQPTRQPQLSELSEWRDVAEIDVFSLDPSQWSMQADGLRLSAGYETVKFFPGITGEAPTGASSRTR